MPYIIMGTIGLLGLVLLLFIARLVVHRLVMPKTNVDAKLPPSGAHPWSRVRFPNPHGNAGNTNTMTAPAGTPPWSAPSGPLEAGFPTVANSFVQANNPFVGGFGPGAGSTPAHALLTNGEPTSGFAWQNGGFGSTASGFGTPTNGFLPTDSSMLPPGSGAFPLSNDGFAPASSGFSALYGLAGSSPAPASVASPALPTTPAFPSQPQAPQPQNTGWLKKLHKASTLHEYSPAPEAARTPDLNASHPAWMPGQSSQPGQK